MNEICTRCGHRSQEEHPRFCSACGSRIDDSDRPAGSESEIRNEDKKNPQVAVFCSSLIPGLGQVYNGETLKGFILFLCTITGLFLLLIPGLVIWIYSMYDAYSISGKMNDGSREYRPVQQVHMILFVMVAVFIVIALVIAITIMIISGMLSLLGPAGNDDFSQMLQFSWRFL